MGVHRKNYEERAVPVPEAMMEQLEQLHETAINQIKTFSNPKKGYSSDFLITVGERALGNP